MATQTIKRAWVMGAGVTLAATVLAGPILATPAGADTSSGSTTVNVEMQGPSGILDIPANGSASVYYQGSWQAIDGLNSNNHKMVQAKLDPGTYSFAATYNGTRQQVNGVTVGTSAKTVYFQAASVSVTLQDHKGGSLTADSASYYAGGWHTMTGGQALMLPGAYSFAATYNGTRQQKDGVTVAQPNSNNGANRYQTVGFQTTLANVALQSLSCTGHVNGFIAGDASYYAGGWNAITTPNGNNAKMLTAEMLPGTYSFAASTSDSSVQGARQQKNGVVIGAGPIQSVYFSFAAANCS